MKLRIKSIFLCILTIFIFVVFIWLPKSVTISVEGWYANTSKTVRDYVSEKIMPRIIPEDFCDQGGFLLVIILSNPTNFHARSVIRKTWAKRRNNVSFYFLLGEPKNNSAVQTQIEQESSNYSDIIQDRFIDHHNNSTLKSVQMLKLFINRCEDYKYIMKIDDDVFLNTNLVLQMLSKRQNTTHVLLGKVLNNTSPLRDTSSEWYVPYELYPDENYPNFLCGTTYIMSADVAVKLYNCTISTPIFYIEDVYITGICAKKMNVTLQDDTRIICNRPSKNLKCQLKNLYAIHYQTPDMILNDDRILKNNECSTRTPLTV